MPLFDCTGRSPVYKHYISPAISPIRGPWWNRSLLYCTKLSWQKFLEFVLANSYRQWLTFNELRRGDSAYVSSFSFYMFHSPWTYDVGLNHSLWCSFSCSWYSLMFLDQELIPYRYSSSCFCCDLFKKPKALLFQMGSGWNLIALFFS